MENDGHVVGLDALTAKSNLFYWTIETADQREEMMSGTLLLFGVDLLPQ